MTKFKLYGVKHAAKSISHWGLFNVPCQFWNRTPEEIDLLFPDWDF